MKTFVKTSFVIAITCLFVFPALAQTPGDAPTKLVCRVEYSIVGGAGEGYHTEFKTVAKSLNKIESDGVLYIRHDEFGVPPIGASLLAYFRLASEEGPFVGVSVYINNDNHSQSRAHGFKRGSSVEASARFTIPGTGQPCRGPYTEPGCVDTGYSGPPVTLRCTLM